MTLITFNTPLEMRRPRRQALRRARDRNFQYSIRDAYVLQEAAQRYEYASFNTPLEMRRQVSRRGHEHYVLFQYSIRDAIGSHREGLEDSSVRYSFNTPLEMHISEKRHSSTQIFKLLSILH